MQSEAERIAAGLTKAQRRIVVGLPTDGSFIDAYTVCRQRRTRMALTNAGVTEPYRQGAVTLFAQFRLTPLGLEVRRILTGEA